MRNPNTFAERISAQQGKIDWVVIDEVQKAPKLLDLVHLFIESSSLKFALTGSSARKLKKGSANLLAGRAFVNHLFPLTHLEIAKDFDIQQALRWGTLPKILKLSTPQEKKAFLRSYALTYLKEEVWAEHLIRNLTPFRRFLEVAAQSNGEILNYTNIARDVGADVKTVQSYFEILEDSLLGFLLEAYHPSIRKQQRKSPKFYFFDLGVQRALARQLESPLIPKTYAYGKAFEHWVILEIFRLNQYQQREDRLFYLQTKDHAKIDLIVERPNQETLLIEIKSTREVDDRHTRNLERFLKDFPRSQALLLSQDPHPKKIGNVMIYPWDQGIKKMLYG